MGLTLGSSFGFQSNSSSGGGAGVFLKADGTIPLTANWNAGTFGITANTFTANNGFLFNNGIGGSLVSESTTGISKTWTLPNTTGTIALISDINPPVIVKDEGVVLTNALASLNFTGAGVTSSVIGNDVTVNVDNSGVSSVGLTMPPAFGVSNSPIVDSGTIGVTALGLSSQYIRGDGQLANFPTSFGGGSSVNYYFNGGTSQGSFGGTTYYQMGTNAVTGSAIDFTLNSITPSIGFITDSGVPDELFIPNGSWILRTYFSQSNNIGQCTVQGSLYKYDGSTFTLLSTGTAESVTNGTNPDLYTYSIPIPSGVTLTRTDRLAIVITAGNFGGGRTVTLYTQDSKLAQVQTTYSTGLNSLNGLTDQVQYFATGTSGTFFNISSVGDTHTFNLPIASSLNSGALSNTDWITFNNKGNGDLKANGTVPLTANWNVGAYGITANTFIANNGFGFNVGLGGSLVSANTTGSAKTWTLPNTTGTIALTSDLPSLSGYLKADGTVPLTADWNVGAYQITANKFIGNNGFGFNIGLGGSLVSASTTGSAKTWTLPNTTGTIALTSDIVSSPIPQASVIYVDSVNGINATTGRGDINTPYLTPEYALSNITNTGTFTANTATNTILSNISNVSNALLEIGMYISGTGIPFGTIIVAKGNQGGNANTVTLSRATTSTATGITATWIKTYNVILNGSFIVSSSLFKDGMYINAQSAEISWGAFKLYDLSTTILKAPYYILGKGNYFGTSISSIFLYAQGAQTAEFTMNVQFGNIETISTGSTFNINTITNEHYVVINGGFVNCRFGTVGYFYCYSTSISFDSYGLLGGISFALNVVSNILTGTHTTASSINVLSGGYYTNSTANLIGSTTWTGFCSHRGRLNGSTHTIGGSCDIHLLDRGNGTVTFNGGKSNMTATPNGGFIINVDAGVECNLYGSDFSLSAINGTLNMYGETDSSSSISGSGTINNYGYVYVVSMGSFTGTFNNYGNISAGQFGGGGNVNNYGSITMIYYGIGVASGKTFINRGTIISNGSLLNSNAIITLNNATSTFENYGSIINNASDITKAVIEKTAGKLYLRQGSYLKVANGKSPIKCTANTSASKDVYYFGVTDNCDGTTYGLTFAFDGTSFAPNDLVGGTLYENVNY